MKYAPVLLLTLSGCLFDSHVQPSGTVDDAGENTGIADGGSAGAGGTGGKGHVDLLKHMTRRDGGVDAGKDAGEGSSAGDAGMQGDDAGAMLPDAAVVPDAAVPADAGEGTDAADATLPPSDGMTCAPCMDDSDCASGYSCRVPGRCLAAPSSSTPCEQIDPSLAASLDGTGESNWCLPAYAIQVQHKSIDAACDSWLSSHGK